MGFLSFNRLPPQRNMSPKLWGRSWIGGGAGAGRDWLGLWYVKVGSSAFYFLCREVFLAASFLKLFFPLAIIAFTSPLKFFCLIFLMAARRLCRIFPGGSDGKTSAYNAGDLGLIPGLGRTPGEGNGNPLQYSCLDGHREHMFVYTLLLLLLSCFSRVRLCATP